MEELLNKLIKRGWRPFGIEGIKEFHLRTYECERGTNKIMIKHFEGYFTDGIKTSDYPRDYGSRMYVVYGLKHIVAKESGLWQFCIANHLLKIYSDLGDDDEYVIGRWQNGMDGKTTDGEYIDENYDSDIYHQDESYQRWLMESALCNEEDLEKFLLDNIKVKG